MRKEELNQKSGVDVTPLPTEETGHVVLPIGYEEFGEFIRSLLGRPQAIGKRIDGPFEVSLQDVKALHHLIDQRIAQQNESTLVEFHVVVAYDDGSTVELKSADDLFSYNEVRPVISTGVTLEWIYLVRFQDKTVPERQEVSVTFDAGSSTAPLLRSDLPGFFIEGMWGGHVAFRIEHTARTWGADLEALITNQIARLRKAVPPLKKFVRRHSTRISFAAAALLFASAAVAASLTTRAFAAERTAEMTERLLDVPTAGQIEIVAEFIASGTWSHFYFAMSVFFLTATFAVVGIGIWLQDSANTVEPSFVLLTKESFKHRDMQLKRLQRKWLSFITGILLTLVLSVAGNWLFAWLFL